MLSFFLDKASAASVAVSYSHMQNMLTALHLLALSKRASAMQRTECKDFLVLVSTATWRLICRRAVRPLSLALLSACKRSMQ